jgi:cellulose synthase/poly-beta-1,6-N-acetylglucosamine synthase-like glycosyltransferase
MAVVWVILASLTFLIVATTLVLVRRGVRSLTILDQVPAELEGRSWPSVSVIVPARNEERDIEAALRSLLKLDYQPLEIVLVDDRSTDRTGAILDRMAAESPRLNVLHVQQLPSGWIGKNYALHVGAATSESDFLLFTDADVVMEPTTVRRAVRYAVSNRVDHLTVTPRAVVPSQILNAFVVVFTNLFAIFTRPWKVSDPDSNAHIGIGAFNMISRSVYEAIGTHQAIAMRPDDDIKLGKLVKLRHYRQDAVIGRDFVSVPWYASLQELIHGMEKNAFSGVDYRISAVIGATMALLLLDVWPFIAIFVLRGPAQVLYALTVAVLLLHSWLSAWELRASRWSVVLFPVAVLLLIFIQWRAMLLTFVNRGIRWRDTHYSLDDLRANKIE